MPSAAFETVMRFQSLMVGNLSASETTTPEERLARILEILSPDVVFRVAESLPYGGVFVGHDGFREMGRRFGETWRILDGGTHEYVDAGGGLVIASQAPTFQSVATGRSVSFEMVEYIRARDGKVVELVPYYFDTVKLVEAFTDREPAA
jgi:ketosteroid isomerase-like protein